MSQEESFDDWELISDEWWKVPFNVVPWDHRLQFQWSPEGVRSAIHPRPPYYHDSLYNDKNDAPSVSGEIPGDSLNTSLVGVKGAEESLRRYESDVGIIHLPLVSEGYHNTLFDGDIDEAHLAMVQKSWHDQVLLLLDGILPRTVASLPRVDELEGDERRIWDLDAIDDSPLDTSPARTSPDVVDLTYSDSAESDPPPSTPHNDRKSYAAVVFDDNKSHSLRESTVIAPSPSKPLSASALSFIPASGPSRRTPSPSPGSPYKSPTYEFHFPSLTSNPRLGARSLPPNLEKDDQGFYNEIPSPSPASRSHTSTRTATPRRPSTTLLPAFLTDSSSSSRNRHTSKTRELVDRLRSGDSSRKQRSKNTSVSLSLDPDEIPSTERPNAQELESTADKIAAIDGWITSIENEAMAADAAAQLGDGWIEGVSKETRSGDHHKHKRSRSKNHKRSTSTTSGGTSVTPVTPSTASSSATTGTFPSPASSMTSFGIPYTPTSASFSTLSQPPPTPAVAAYAYAPQAYVQYMTPAQAQAAYMQMQLQLQMQARWQQMQAAACMGVVSGYPVYTPVPQSSQFYS
ncbi:hypothetical protein ABKN59_010079 [Abortiporus biennis]